MNAGNLTDSHRVLTPGWDLECMHFTWSGLLWAWHCLGTDLFFVRM